MSGSEKSWHAPLRLQNNSCLINIFLALVRFRTAPASCLLKGLATQIWVMWRVENIWTWCDIIPTAGDEKIWLTCWKLKYVSQFPSCLSLTNDPPFTFLSWPTWGSSQSRRQQIYAIPPRWQPWNPRWQNYGGGGIQNKRGLMLLCRGAKARRPCSVESSYRDHAGIKTPVICVAHKQQTAIASLSTLFYGLQNFDFVRDRATWHRSCQDTVQLTFLQSADPAYVSHLYASTNPVHDLTTMSEIGGLVARRLHGKWQPFETAVSPFVSVKLADIFDEGPWRVYILEPRPRFQLQYLKPFFKSRHLQLRLRWPSYRFLARTRSYPNPNRVFLVCLAPSRAQAQRCHHMKLKIEPKET